MWQRIQTIFLVLAVISMVATIFFPIWVAAPGGIVQRVLTPLYYEVKGEDPVYIPYCLTGILAITAATMAFIEVRKFRNRILQIKLGAFNSLMMAGTVFSAVLFANRMIGDDTRDWQYGFGLFMPVAGMTFNFLANRFIRRDERLVREAGRLR